MTLHFLSDEAHSVCSALMLCGKHTYFTALQLQDMFYFLFTTLLVFKPLSTSSGVFSGGNHVMM